MKTAVDSNQKRGWRTASCATSAAGRSCRPRPSLFATVELECVAEIELQRYEGLRQDALALTLAPLPNEVHDACSRSYPATKSSAYSACAVRRSRLGLIGLQRLLERLVVRRQLGRPGSCAGASPRALRWTSAFPWIHSSCKRRRCAIPSTKRSGCAAFTTSLGSAGRERWSHQWPHAAFIGSSHMLVVKACCQSLPPPSVTAKPEVPHT